MFKIFVTETNDQGYEPVAVATLEPSRHDKLTDDQIMEIGARPNKSL
jgi:hypothetical protein